MLIEHDNIIYMSDLPDYGGTSTYVVEMCKKYKDRDIAVVCKTSQPNMVKKVKQYCRVYHIKPNDKIKCKVIIINFDSSICDQVVDGKIYMTLHADYSNPLYNGMHPNFRDRIDGYISITKGIQKWLKETCNKDSQVIYNPLEVEDNKPLILMSATRMSREKGRDRTKALAEALDRAGVNYIWYIFTSDEDTIKSPNVIFIKNRTDLDKFMYMADYGVQLSDSEGLSYTINEFLYRNKPVIVTPLPYLDEIGVKDGVNSYIMNFDCNNIDYIVQNIKNVPKFQFNHLDDDYSKILAEGKSKYEEGKKMKARVKALSKFSNFLDAERGVIPKVDDEWITSMERAEYLCENGVVEIIEEIKEENDNELKQENVSRETKEEPKEEKPKKKGRKKIDTVD